MAISTFFQDEINLVDPTKTLTYQVNVAYDDFEFSYSGLAIIGGSDLACEYGASELMEEMGFRWYTPNQQFWKRPAAIDTGLAQTQTSFWFKNNAMFLTYGHSWDDIYSADRSTLGNALAKWQTLNGLRVSAFPAGHRWANLINNNQAYFQANPNMIIGTVGASNVKFNLSATGSDYTNMVEIAAAEILRQGLNAYNRTNADATDSDTQSTDLFWPFTKAVAAKVRSGTSAIGDHPARTGVADAQLGAYAYAGHRAEPTLAYTPGVYTQVALGFTAENTWLPLIEAHGPKSDGILLREYFAVNRVTPMEKRHSNVYFDTYDAYEEEGVLGFNAESSANWLTGLVMFRWAIRKGRTGTATHAEALDDVMADLFNDDAAVRSLYEYWSNQANSWHEWSMLDSFEYVNDMQAGWYKTLFQHLMVLLYEDMNMPPQIPLASQSLSTPDPFPAAFSKLMAKVVGVRLMDIFHSYGYLRQEANGAVNTNYPQLRMFASPRPQYWVNPTTPTTTEFNTYLAALRISAGRDDTLDSTDRVLVFNITPVATGTITDATVYNTLGKARYWFIGPGTVTRTESGDGTVTSTVYAVGLHEIAVNAIAKFSNQGGLLFLDTFPLVRKDTDGTGKRHWLYVPNRAAGTVDVRAGSRVRFFDEAGQFDLYPATHASYIDPKNLGPGQVAIDNVNTRDTFYNPGANRYMSMFHDVALMPRTIAEEDFPVYARVKVAA
jgi:hypothetical protein